MCQIGEQQGTHFVRQYRAQPMEINRTRIGGGAGDDDAWAQRTRLLTQRIQVDAAAGFIDAETCATAR